MPIPTLAVSTCRPSRRSRSLPASSSGSSRTSTVGPSGGRAVPPSSSPPDTLPHPLPLPVRQFSRVWWHHRLPPLRRTLVALPKMPALGMRRGPAQPSRGSQTAPAPSRTRGTATPGGGVPKARSNEARDGEGRGSRAPGRRWYCKKAWGGSRQLCLSDGRDNRGGALTALKSSGG